MRRWLLMLAGVLSGNLIYFVLLVPELPPGLRHRPYHIDAGLLLDFVLCLAIYLLLGKVFRERPAASDQHPPGSDEDHPPGHA